MLKEIGTYTDILSGEKDLPAVDKACTKDCSEDCSKHNLYCVYWITVTPSTPRISKLKYALASDINSRVRQKWYYPSGTTKNKFDVFTDGYVGVTKNFKQRMKHHKTRLANKAPLHSLIKLYGKDIRFYILHDNLTKSEALNLENFYRPKRRIGWNIAKGGMVVPKFKTNKPKKLGKKVFVCNMETKIDKMILVEELETFLRDNPTWRKGGYSNNPAVIYRRKKCFENIPYLGGHYITAEELKQYCIEQRKLNCTRPTACCLDYMPLDDFANGYINSLQKHRRHDSQKALTKVLANAYLKRQSCNLNLSMRLYTLENGVERKTFTREEWAKFFNCSVYSFKRYANAKHFVERDGKSYPARKKHGKSYPIFKIPHPIYDWKVVKIETKGAYAKTLNTERG